MSAAISALTGGRPVRVRIGPLAGDQAAVPAQDGAGGDEPMCSQLSRQERNAKFLWSEAWRQVLNHHPLSRILLL